VVWVRMTGRSGDGELKLFRGSCHTLSEVVCRSCCGFRGGEKGRLGRNKSRAERLAFAEFDSADHACHFSYFRLMERRRNMKSGSIRKFALTSPPPNFRPLRTNPASTLSTASLEATVPICHLDLLRPSSWPSPLKQSSNRRPPLSSYMLSSRG
jgi:hypothetical protein